MDIQNFINSYYHCFNSRELKQAAQGLVEHYKKGGRLFVTMAGAMSTARMGIILAEMMRKDLVHGVSVTGANLEEDMYLLYDREKYVYLDNAHNITTEQDQKFYEDGVTPDERPTRIIQLLKDQAERSQSELVHELNTSKSNQVRNIQ